MSAHGHKTLHWKISGNINDTDTFSPYLFLNEFVHEFMREFAHEFVDELFTNFVHEFKYEIHTNSYECFARKIAYVTTDVYCSSSI